MKKSVINPIKMPGLGVEGLVQRGSEPNWNWLHKDLFSWGVTFNRHTLAWRISTPQFCRQPPNDVWTLQLVCNNPALYCVWKCVESCSHFYPCQDTEKRKIQHDWGGTPSFKHVDVLMFIVLLLYCLMFVLCSVCFGLSKSFSII